MVHEALKLSCRGFRLSAQGSAGLVGCLSLEQHSLFFDRSEKRKMFFVQGLADPSCDGLELPWGQGLTSCEAWHVLRNT
jgi:hypothetical protein